MWVGDVWLWGRSVVIGIGVELEVLGLMGIWLWGLGLLRPTGRIWRSSLIFTSFTVVIFINCIRFRSNSGHFLEISPGNHSSFSDWLFLDGDSFTRFADTSYLRCRSGWGVFRSVTHPRISLVRATCALGLHVVPGVSMKNLESSVDILGIVMMRKIRKLLDEKSKGNYSEVWK